MGSNSVRTYFNLGLTICRFDLSGNYQVDSGDNAWFYLHDEAGNVILVTDKDGQHAIEFEQDVWGNDLAGNFNDSPYISQHQTGKLWDQEAGLYYNAARWYDPVLGRFISVSPLAPFAEEEYAFCGNDPVNFADINGLEFFELSNPFVNIGRRNDQLREIAPDVANSFSRSDAEYVAGTIQCAADTAYEIGKEIVQDYAVGAAIGGGVAAVTYGGYKLYKWTRYADEAASLKKGGEYLFNNWDKGTFFSKAASVRYHVSKHGKGRSALQYTQDAMIFYNSNKSLAKSVILKSGAQGLKIQTKLGKKRVGGYWTNSGKLVTFWD